MAQTTHGSLAEDAAAYLRGSGHTIEGVGGNSNEIDRQIITLHEWAQKRNVVLTNAIVHGLKKHTGTTAEHEVFYRASDNRAVKLTYAGTFGVTPDPKGDQQAATPLFYLLRITLMNEVFDSDIKLEGIVMDESLLIGAHGKQPRMVVSQPWIRARDALNPHPTMAELSEFMELLGFSSLTTAYFGWHHKEDDITILDARPDNFISSCEGIVPIDLVINRKRP